MAKGNTKKNRKKKGATSSGQQQREQREPDITELINSVSDDDVLNYQVELPSDVQLDKQGFPTPEVDCPTVEWFYNILRKYHLSGEWGEAFFAVILADMMKDKFNHDASLWTDFSIHPEEKQIEYIQRTTKHVKRKRRERMYKKWVFAMERRGKKHLIPEIEFPSDDIEFPSDDTEFPSDDNLPVSLSDERSLSDEGKAEVIWEGQDGNETTGYKLITPNLFDKGSIRKKKVWLDFPNHGDGDAFDLYEHPLSLACWYKAHMHENKRWIPQYKMWQADKPRRELCAIIQSLIVCFIDHILFGVAHGALNDLRNYKLSQHMWNHAGSKKVVFKTELINQSENNKGGLSRDLSQFIKVLELLLDGGEPDVELKRLIPMLNDVFEDPKGWKTLVLRDFPPLWDAEQRISFYNNLQYGLENNPHSKNALCAALTVAEGCTKPPRESWLNKVPRGSLYDHVLHFPSEDLLNSPVQYDDSTLQQVRFIRNTFEHFSDKPKFQYMSARRVELELSNMFSGFLLDLYCGMCMVNTFLP